jgi:hypothetical protein
VIGQKIVTVGPYKITRLSGEQVSVERNGVPREEAEPARVQLLVLALVDEVIALRQALEQRFAECKLELHPQKTKIAYCKDTNRRGSYPEQRFDFLGYTFRPRRSKNRKGQLFVSFSPAVSDKAAKAMRETMRRWRLHHRGDLGLDDLVRWTRSVIHGWVLYYGRFYPSALQRALRTLDTYLVRWALRKYKRLKGHKSRAWDWLARLQSRHPTLFPHWNLGATVGR